MATSLNTWQGSESASEMSALIRKRKLQLVEFFSGYFHFPVSIDK